MFSKCTLLVVYFTIVFVVTRFLEFAGVTSDGMRCSEKCTNKQTLNTKQLRKVLDHRGIGYRHVIQRTELMSLVDLSGNFYIIVGISRIISFLYEANN